MLYIKHNLKDIWLCNLMPLSNTLPSTRHHKTASPFLQPFLESLDWQVVCMIRSADAQFHQLQEGALWKQAALCENKWFRTAGELRRETKEFLKTWKRQSNIPGMKLKNVCCKYLKTFTMECIHEQWKEREIHVSMESNRYREQTLEPHPSPPQLTFDYPKWWPALTFHY